MLTLKKLASFALFLIYISPSQEKKTALGWNCSSSWHKLLKDRPYHQPQNYSPQAGVGGTNFSVQQGVILPFTSFINEERNEKSP